MEKASQEYRQNYIFVWPSTGATSLFQVYIMIKNRGLERDGRMPKKKRQNPTIQPYNHKTIRSAFEKPTPDFLYDISFASKPPH